MSSVERRVVVRDVEFSTDFLRGPQIFEKTWEASIERWFSRVVGTLIFEASFWNGVVRLRAAVKEGDSIIYMSDFDVFKGPVKTLPFEFVAKTVKFEFPVETRKFQSAVLQLTLSVRTSLGALKGRIVEIGVE